ncbi:GNAT family N-acetyltransferase [Vagococcus sp.]|uniref:GNAT family N-acetyltransferase n=1 Tax=Vagococcus sp. TaxID=1933889 RepID=UPI003F9D9E8C
MDIQYNQLNLDEMKTIYFKYMKKDFPENELKEWAMLHSLWLDQHYSGYMMKVNGELVGYACFIWDHPKYLMLDYFAIVEEKRSLGYGSQMLQWIQKETRKQHLILECENPKSASGHEQKLRQRRIAFYLRHGVKLTAIETQIVGVDYCVLQTGEKLEDEKVLKVKIKELYQHFAPELDIKMNENGVIK